MEWTYSAYPNPETSAVWSDDFWPPKDWCHLIESTLEKVERLWPWDNLPAAKKLVNKMTEEQFMLLSVHHVVWSIFGGGFDSGLDNLSGEFAEEAVIGLRRFGFTRHAEIMDQAWDAYGIRPIPRKCEERRNHFIRMKFVELPPGWSEMQNEFYDLLLDTKFGKGVYPGFHRPLAEFINLHRNRFFIT